MTDLELNQIAVIGVAGRFPGAKDVRAFWLNLARGTESISFLSDEELIAAGADPDLVRKPNYIKARGILGDVDLFDAPFFGLHPREAALLDPQHRLFLESSWTALEDAGYSPTNCSGRVGVFAGQSMNTYLLAHLYSEIDLVQSVESLQVSIGNDKDSLTTEVAYRMGLTGPAVTIQSSSSTSLVAIHYACQSLLNYECDLALAGGVTVHLPEKAGYLYYEGGTTSPDGHCRTFDARAEGFVAGHGVGVVVLKRLSDAIADGDTVRAVIRGSAVNNDGALKVSYMAPSVEGQAQVVAMAQAMAGVKPEDISYVEAHGTGTPIGDPIEIAALTQAFRIGTDKTQFCALGSVKPNIGHLDSAAGVAGLIKTVLALEHKLIPPTLHFEKPNPALALDSGPFYVNTSLLAWKPNGARRIAGVSSFGMGGTNAHMVVEEPPNAEPSGPSRSQQLLLLSARTKSALESMTDNLIDYLNRNSDSNLADVAYTLQMGRKLFEHRRMLVCYDLSDATTALSAHDPQRVYTVHQGAVRRPVMFLFSGQGSQYVNMGRELYEQEAMFRQTIDFCAHWLEPYLGLNLVTVLYPTEKDAERADRLLAETRFTQPALFAFEYALALLWMTWGVKPHAMLGHSIGEYVAACLSGLLSLEDALVVVAARGQLMQQMPGGAMVAVALSEPDLLPYLNDAVSLSAINGPANCVVSGPYHAIDMLRSRLEQEGIKCHRLRTSHAFHSVMMEPAVQPFRQKMCQVALHQPLIPYISNVTGTWMTAADALDPEYWAEHLRQPVRFSDGVRELLSEQDAILLEVGPGNTLATLARQQMSQSSEQIALASLPHPNERQSDMAFLVNTLGRLWLAGVGINWTDFHQGESRHRISLPTYPFERARYWVDAGERPKHQKQKRSTTSTSKLPPAEWFYLPSWKQTPPPGKLKSGSLVQHQESWLLFVSDNTACLGSALARRLVEEGQIAITVCCQSGFTRLNEWAFAIDPRSRTDYEQLVEEVGKMGPLPTRLIHLWGVSYDEIASFEAAQEMGLSSLLLFVQALNRHPLATSLDITVAANGLHQVVGTEPLSPEKCTIFGACKVIPQEYAEITCNIIDLTLPEPGSRYEAWLVECLLAECTSAEKPHTPVAYRGRQRWIQKFEAVSPNGTHSPDTFAAADGAYVIVGGLGEIGFTLAHELARWSRSSLVLTGRTQLPRRESWADWLASHDERNPISHKIRRVQMLESLGADVLVVSADAADPLQMSMVINETLQRFGSIHGVIYAAGTVNQETFLPVRDINPDSLAVEIATQVQGLVVLEDVLRGQAVDLCLVTSSLASILGGLGLAGYAAAHAFMDAFVYEHNRKEQVPWLVINWDGWESTAEQLASQENRFGGQTITTEEAVNAFRFILTIAEQLPAQLLVSTTNVQLKVEQWLGHEPIGKGHAERDERSEFQPRPNLQNAYVAPHDDLEREIAAIWQEVLGIEQVGTYDNFFELGGNSLVGVRLIAQLNERLALRIPAVTLYEAPTVRALAKTIDAERDKGTEENAFDSGRRRGQFRLEQMKGKPSRNRDPDSH